MLVNLLNRLVDTFGDEGYPDTGAPGLNAVVSDEEAALRRRESEYQKYLLSRTTARVIIGL